MQRVLAACGLAFAACLASADELDVARAALRDGLWGVAMRHAAPLASGAGTNATARAARLVVLESLASADDWAALAKTLKSWPDAAGPEFDYYRAISTNDLPSAIAALGRLPSPETRVQAQMLEADLCVRAGNRAGAEKLWRGVIATSNATVRLQAVAGCNLGDVGILRRLYAETAASALRCLVGLRLGRILLAKGETAAEGSAIIRKIVKDTPDAAGAREAFLAMADAEAAAAHWTAADQVYRDALEIWPDAARSGRLQEGRGWVYLQLGRRELALEAFGRAADYATNDADRARALLRQGDALSDAGRGAEAMERYRQVLSKYPKTPVAETLKGILAVRELEAEGRELYRQYRFSEARKVFSEVAARDPSRTSRMDSFKVLCAYGLGQDDEAEREAKRLALEATDRNVRAEMTLWLAKFSYNRGNWREAVRLFLASSERMADAARAAEALVWASRAALADADFKQAVGLVTQLVERYPEATCRPSALLVQGEALIELARFDEAVLVLDGVATAEGVGETDRTRARLLKADALFAMGADDTRRYQAALDTYRAVRFEAKLELAERLTVAFKIGRTLEKLKRMDEAIDQYYSEVVLAYREGRERGQRVGDEARAVFVRAAFRIADEYEGRGKGFQATKILELVAASDVPAAAEARRRIDRILKEGRL